MKYNLMAKLMPLIMDKIATKTRPTTPKTLYSSPDFTITKMAKKTETRAVVNVLIAPIL